MCNWNEITENIVVTYSCINVATLEIVNYYNAQN